MLDGKSQKLQSRKIAEFNLLENAKLATLYINITEETHKDLYGIMIWNVYQIWSK